MVIIYTWDGGAMVPEQRFRRLCDREFVVGQVYRLDVAEHRSINSHRHYFAAINDAWGSLPEDVVERFPTPEHLRKFALVKAGYADSRSIVAASRAQAQRIAAFVKPMDEFAVVTVSEAVVTVYTARSQSIKAMGAKEFQLSKQAVLGVIAGMIGVSQETLASEAGRAA